MKKLVLFVATVVAVALAACSNNAEEAEATEEVAVEAPAEEVIDTLAAVVDTTAAVVEEVAE